jgi:hypothetical protein
MKLAVALSVALAFIQAVRADLLPSSATDQGLWIKKGNTSITHRPARSLQMEVRSGAFNYGWVQRPLTTNTLPGPLSAGLYGRFRSSSATSAQVTLTVILRAGKEQTYFSCSQANLSDSAGEWVEFYAPFDLFRSTSDARAKTLKASDIREGDGFQISLNSIAGEKAVAEFDRLRFLDRDEAATVGRAINRAATRRLLIPENRCAEAPHPRLLLSPSRLQHLHEKVSAGGLPSLVYTGLLAYAERTLKTHSAENPFEAVLHFQAEGDMNAHQRSARLEGKVTAAVIPIEILAAAYRITGDERYGRHAAQALVKAARAIDCESEILNSGFYYTRTFYVRALAFGYDWLCPLLTPAERRDVKATLLGFVLKIHADSWSATWGRRPLHRVWNWDPGLVSSAGLGMLALEGETSTAEKTILFDLRRHLRDYLTLGIDRDGAGHEGPGYIAYGIGAGPEFAECLREQGRGDLFTETNWHLIPPWLVAETLPDRNRWNNLSDCGHGLTPAAVYSYTCGRLAELARAQPAGTARRLAVPEDLLKAKDYLWQFSEAPGIQSLTDAALASLMGWVWEGGLGKRIEHASAPAQLAFLLFHEPCVPADDPADLLPLALHFRGRGLAVSRTGYSTEALHLAVEAGPHAAGHDQADKGSFTLVGYGSDLAIDSGYGNDGERFKSGSSHAHNMVLINGQGQPMTWHNQSSGHLSGYHHGELLDWVRVDAREAWNVRYDSEWRPQPAADPVDKATRHFLFVRGTGTVPPYLVVMDDIRKDGTPADYTWLWHIPAGMRFRCEADRWTAAPLRVRGTVLTTAPGRPQGGASFTFTAPVEGRYWLAGLVRAGGADTGKSDSFGICLNGGKRQTWDLRATDTFGWTLFIPRETGETNGVPLRAGEPLRVDLYAREPEAQISKLALVQLGTSLSVPPDECPSNSLIQTADHAVFLNPPLLRQPIPLTQDDTPRATLTVFPVTTDARSITNTWFETSREGRHPRLAHTVRAVSPRFFMILVPGKPGTPLPRVRSMPCEGGVAAELCWDGATDQVLFSEQEARTTGCTTDGQAVFIRRASGAPTTWSLLDGTQLVIDGQDVIPKSATRTILDGAKPALR